MAIYAIFNVATQNRNLVDVRMRGFYVEKVYDTKVYMAIVTVKCLIIFFYKVLRRHLSERPRVLKKTQNTRFDFGDFFLPLGYNIQLRTKCHASSYQLRSYMIEYRRIISNIKQLMNLFSYNNF